MTEQFNFPISKPQGSGLVQEDAEWESNTDELSAALALMNDALVQEDLDRIAD